VLITFGIFTDGAFLMFDLASFIWPDRSQLVKQRSVMEDATQRRRVA
jgi:hypothetical protein